MPGSCSIAQCARDDRPTPYTYDQHEEQSLSSAPEPCTGNALNTRENSHGIRLHMRRGAPCTAELAAAVGTTSNAAARREARTSDSKRTRDKVNLLTSDCTGGGSASLKSLMPMYACTAGVRHTFLFCVWWYLRSQGRPGDDRLVGPTDPLDRLRSRTNVSQAGKGSGWPGAVSQALSDAQAAGARGALLTSQAAPRRRSWRRLSRLALLSLLARRFLQGVHYGPGH